MSKYFKISTIWLIFIVLVMTESCWTPRFLPRNPYVIILFYEVVIFFVVFCFNHFWIKQTVSFIPTTPAKEQLLVMILPVMAFLVLNWAVLSLAHEKTIWTLLLVAISVISVGLLEEYFFRGLIVSSVLSTTKNVSYKVVVSSAVISSLIFGLTHSVNILDQGLQATLVQMASASITGLLFATVYLRTGSIIWPIILHALNDNLGFISHGVGHSTILSVSPIFLLPLIFSIWALRKSRFFDKEGNQLPSFGRFLNKISNQ